MFKEWVDIILLFLRKSRNVLKQDVNGKPIKHTWCSDLLFFALSLSMATFLPNGFSSGFIDYTTNILSIFVGFFITVLVFVDDKIKMTHIPSKQEEDATLASQRLTQEKRIRLLQENNYIVRFFYTLGLNILFSAFVLVLLLPNVLWFDMFSFDVSQLRMIEHIPQLSWENIKLGLSFWGLIAYRIIVIYFLLKIFFYTTYATSSIVSVLILKREEKV